MSHNSFTVYKGKFRCKSCNDEVFSLRLWHETGKLTWMCKQKHITEVELIQPKRKKSDRAG